MSGGSKKEDDDFVELHIESTNPSDPSREIPIDTNEKLSLLIESVARNACLPRIPDNEPLDAKSIEPYVQTVEKSLTILNVILDKFQRKQIKAIKQLDPIERCTVLNLLLLCGEHQYITLTWPCEAPWVSKLNEAVKESSVWITPETNQMSSELLAKLEHMTRKTTPELLSLYADMCIYKLNKQGAETKQWAQHPGTVHCYLWILSHVEPTQLLAYLQELRCVPFLSKVYTNRSGEYKAKALQCYLSLLSRMREEDIRQAFDPDKLSLMFKTTLYTSQDELILPSMHCLVRLMQAKQRSGDVRLLSFDWNLVDDVRNDLLTIMETASTERQVIFMEAFTALVAYSQVSVVRWHYAIMRMIERCVPQTALHASVLSLFECYLLNTWPFIASFSEAYCSYLFKILMECLDEEVEQQVYKCFYLIRVSCEEDERLSTFLTQIREQVKNKRIIKLIDHEFDESQYPEIQHFSIVEVEGDED